MFHIMSRTCVCSRTAVFKQVLPGSHVGHQRDVGRPNGQGSLLHSHTLRLLFPRVPDWHGNNPRLSGRHSAEAVGASSEDLQAGQALRHPG